MTAASSTPDLAASGFMQRHHFLLRRLHSLSGIVPVGLFVIFHLFTNAQMVMDPKGETFQHEVGFIHDLPALLIIEISLWVGIGFHAVLGFWYTFTGKSNASKYGYGANWRYTFQRVTGMTALVFIFLHVATLRWRWDFFGWFTPFYYKGYDSPEVASLTGLSPELVKQVADAPMSMPFTAYALQFSVVVLLLYVIGVASVVYHWSNGLWTAAITWGLTVSKAAQQRWGVVCLLLFIALTLFWGAAIYAAMAYDFNEMTDPQKIAFIATVEDGAVFLESQDVPLPPVEIIVVED